MYRALQSLFLQRGQNVPHAFGYFMADRHICVWRALMRFFYRKGKEWWALEGRVQPTIRWASSGALFVTNNVTNGKNKAKERCATRKELEAGLLI